MDTGMIIRMGCTGIFIGGEGEGRERDIGGPLYLPEVLCLRRG